MEVDHWGRKSKKRTSDATGNIFTSMSLFNFGQSWGEGREKKGNCSELTTKRRLGKTGEGGSEACNKEHDLCEDGVPSKGGKDLENIRRREKELLSIGGRGAERITPKRVTR